MKKPRISESEIQSQITDWLSLKGIMWYRQNTGMLQKGKHWVRFGHPGAPDLIAIHRGMYIGIEVKAAKGQQSEAQELFQTNLERAGGIYLLARTLEDVTEVLYWGRK